MTIVTIPAEGIPERHVADVRPRLLRLSIPDRAARPEGLHRVSRCLHAESVMDAERSSLLR